MAITDAARLRSMLGEEIPAGGDASATMFSDEKIDSLMSDAGGDLRQAAMSGWQIKAAQYAELVDVTEGNSSRKMSDLHKNALRMVDFYATGDPTPADGVGGRNVVIGTISRAGQRR